MTQKEKLLLELEQARDIYLRLLESIPESEYSRQSGNEAWTVGDALFHITLGPLALALEAWMILHARGLFQSTMNHFPSRTFNRANAWFAHRDSRRLTRAGLAKGYEKGHAALRSVVKRAREEDLARSVIYPADFVSELAGEVSIERIVHYAKGHVELHAAQIQESLRAAS